MNVIEKNIRELKPYKRNPRDIRDAIGPVSESIKMFGFKQPIVIDKDNVVVAGHVRLEAAKKLGMKKVPCVVADDLTEEEVKAYRLADNRTRDLSKWDSEKLIEELDKIEAMGVGIDMGEFGFTIVQETVNDSSQFEDERPNEGNVSSTPVQREDEDPEEDEEEESFEHICPSCGHKFNGGTYLSF